MASFTTKSLLWFAVFCTLFAAKNLEVQAQLHNGDAEQKTQISLPPPPTPPSAPVIPPPVVQPPTIAPPPLNCSSACEYRCSLAGRPKLCIRACGTCCVRCKCVPPGTAGNHHICGDCYNGQTTHGGRIKCP